MSSTHPQFQSELLSHFVWLRYGLSERQDGSLRLFQEDDPNYRNTKLNRERYLTALGLDPTGLVGAKLVHGKKVVFVDETIKKSAVSACDGLVTDIPDRVMSVTAADCVPVYLVDPIDRRVGVVHAGWRGILAGVLSAGIQQFIDHGSKLADIRVVIGPHVQAHHFRVQDDVWPLFADYPETRIEKDGEKFINLAKVLESQALLRSIKQEHLEISSVCTFCETDQYFSFRRDQPEIIEAMMAWIVKVSEPAC